MLTVAQKAPAKAKTFPVIEIFGPTIQGEGAEAGLPTHFVRLGGCDYRCSWCDTMYAVDPATVRRDAVRMGVEEICAALDRLRGAPAWVSLSGGNPALHHLGELVDALHAAGSPGVGRDPGVGVAGLARAGGPANSQPEAAEFGHGHPAPSSRSSSDSWTGSRTRGRAPGPFSRSCASTRPISNGRRRSASAYPRIPLLLSAGTPVPADGPVRDRVGDRYRWLCEQVAADPELATRAGAASASRHCLEGGTRHMS